MSPSDDTSGIPPAASAAPNSAAAAVARRRSSVVNPPLALSTLFQRRNSVTSSTLFPFPGPATDAHRRLSISIGLGGGTSPIPSVSPSWFRRGSGETASDPLTDENAVEEEDVAGVTARTAPATPANRRMSISAQSAFRGFRPASGSSGANDPPGFNWAEQLRTQAENAIRPPVPVARPAVAPQPPQPQAMPVPAPLPQPPVPAVVDRRSAKLDHFQERILKGDFLND